MKRKKLLQCTVMCFMIAVISIGVMAFPLPLVKNLFWHLGLESVFAAIPPAIQTTSPTEGQVLNRDSIAVTGTADAGVSVDVFVDGALAASTAADGQGNWSVSVGPLIEGDHTYYARATDSEANIGTTATVDFRIDLSLPAILISYPVDGSYANRPVIEGLSEPGAAVTVHVYGRESTVIADASGSWSYPDPSLPEGNHSVYAVSTDQAGNTQTSGTTNFILDMTRPRVLPDIFPAEATTQVPLDVAVRVYLVENSPIDPSLLNNAITLLQKNSSVTGDVYGSVYDMVYESMVAGTVYSRIFTAETSGPVGLPDTCYELVFVPDALLNPATTYLTSVNPNIADAAGNPVTSRQWFFTTAGGVVTANPHGNYIENVNVCVNCHTPHRATSSEIVEPYGIQSALIDDYCSACHDGTSAPVPQGWGEANRHDYKISREGTTGPSACTSCHNPHLKWTSENPNLLQDFYFYQHNDPTNPYLPNSSEQALCELCHDSAIMDDDRVAYEQYRYKRSNTSSGPAGNYSLCLGCHNGVTAVDIKTLYTAPSGHVIQARDGSLFNGPIPCSDCHDTHGSNNLKLLKSELGHYRGQEFIIPSLVWDPATERKFCMACHNNSTEVFGVVAGFVYETPGHESANSQACSVCHGGTPIAAAHGPN